METIFVGVAWPYSNYYLHLGHVAGFAVPCDTFARYHRMKGNKVLMVSGSDCHGTPIVVRAEKEGKAPADVARFYHEANKKGLEQVGVSYDNFTTTTTENHYAVTQEMFRRNYENGYIYRKTVQMLYDPQAKRFLPDRFVEGNCPHCGDRNARGDQCDACGRLLDPMELRNPRSKLTGATPEVRDSEHCFLDLGKYEKALLSWMEGKEKRWRPNVWAFTRNWIKGRLRGRAITRDIAWGVPIPLEGLEKKRIYVWFDAVTGYLSASKEWAQRDGDSDAWREWWENGDAKHYYFIAKDNIPFHTIIWPAMLMGYGGLTLPYDVPSNEYLTLEGRPFSTSQNWALWLPDYLERYDPDPLRYYLTINAPEARDSDFSWSEFVRRNNDELVAAWANLVHRTLSVTYKNFEGRVPSAGEPDEQARQLLADVDAAFDEAGDLIAQCKFKNSMTRIMRSVSAANVYLDRTAPWKALKEDKAAGGRALFFAIQAINRLKILTQPAMPHIAQNLHALLGFEGDASGCEWTPADVPAGQALRKPKPLVKKLDTSVVEEELERLSRQQRDG